MTPKQRLPRRFPIGTRFVVEGGPDPHGTFRVISRYVVMPDGRRYDLMPRAPARHVPPPESRGGRGPRSGSGPARRRSAEA